MSPQDAMMHLKNMHNGAHAQAGAGVSDPYKDGPFPKGRQNSEWHITNPQWATYYIYLSFTSLVAYQDHSAS